MGSDVRRTPTAAQCTLTAAPESVTFSVDGTTDVVISHNATTSITINGSSSTASDLQVAPGGSQTVAAGGTATFTLKSKKSTGSFSATFAASCGTVNVPVT